MGHLTSEYKNLKVLVITDDSDRHGYFANRVIESGLNVVGVITGAKRIRKKKSLSKIAAPSLTKEQRLVLKAVKKQRDKAESEVAGGEAERFRKDYNNLLIKRVEEEDGDINGPKIVEIIKKLQPDVILVGGATMIRQPLFDLGIPMINTHAGLSPYYRGGRTNMWPILEKDYGYFGFTVHYISPGIDDGNILVSKRLLCQPGDTYSSIDMRGLVEGTDAAIGLLKKMARRLSESSLPTQDVIKEFCGTPQWTKGRVYLNKQYTPEIARKYLNSYESYVEEHIRRQKNGLLDEIREVGLRND